MKVKTLKKFIDQKEKVIPQERYDEIMAKNRLIEPLKEVEEPEEEPEKAEASENVPDTTKKTTRKKTAK